MHGGRGATSPPLPRLLSPYPALFHFHSPCPTYTLPTFNFPSSSLFTLIFLLTYSSLSTSPLSPLYFSTSADLHLPSGYHRYKLLQCQVCSLGLRRAHIILRYLMEVEEQIILTIWDENSRIGNSRKI